MSARRAIKNVLPARLARYLGIVAMGLLALSMAFPLAAQDRAALARLLRDGSDFRVRVQAAYAIGNTRDPIMRPQLERALRDNNAAVRAAAATALGRLGSSRAIPALRRVLRDREVNVRNQAERSIELLRGGGDRSASASSSSALRPGPGTHDWSRVRAAVVLGDMRNRSEYRAAAALERRFRTEVQSNLRQLSRVLIFDDASRMSGAERQQIGRRRLPFLRLDGSLTSVQPERRSSGLAVRCEVSLVLLDEPGRNLRGMLRGAATGMDRHVRDPRRQEARLAEEAMSAAVRSAMSTADVAIARASHR